MHKVDTLLGILLFFIALPMFLIGFKIINPFRKELNPEREFIWYKSCGLIVRIIGSLMLLISILLLLRFDIK